MTRRAAKISRPPGAVQVALGSVTAGPTAVDLPASIAIDQGLPHLRFERVRADEFIEGAGRERSIVAKQ